MRLRPLAPADLAAVHTLWTDPGVSKYLWDDEVIPLGRAEAVLRDSEANFTAHGFGLWGAFLPDRGDLAGFCGFAFFGYPSQPELVFGLAPSHWGQGLATELARAMIRHGFETLGFHQIVVSTDPGNVASQRVMEKAGMTRDPSRRTDGIYYLIHKPSV